MNGDVLSLKNHYNKQFWVENTLNQDLEFIPKEQGRWFKSSCGRLSTVIGKLTQLGETLRAEPGPQAPTFCKLSTSFIKHVVDPYNARKKEHVEFDALAHLVNSLKSRVYEQDKQFPFEQLPAEIQVLIFNELDLKTKVTLRQLSSGWKSFVDGEVKFDAFEKMIADGSFVKEEVEKKAFGLIFRPQQVFKNSLFGVKRRKTQAWLVEVDLITLKTIKQIPICWPEELQGFNTNMTVSDHYVIIQGERNSAKRTVVIERATEQVVSLQGFNQVSYEAGYFYVETHNEKVVRKFRKFDFESGQFVKLKAAFYLFDIQTKWRVSGEFLFTHCKDFKNPSIINTRTGVHFECNSSENIEILRLQLMKGVPFIWERKDEGVFLQNLNTGRKIILDFTEENVLHVYFINNAPYFVLLSKKAGDLTLGCLEDFAKLNESAKLPMKVVLKNPKLKRVSLPDKKPFERAYTYLVEFQNTLFFGFPEREDGRGETWDTIVFQKDKKGRYKFCQKIQNFLPLRMLNETLLLGKDADSYYNFETDGDSNFNLFFVLKPALAPNESKTKIEKEEGGHS